MKKPPKIMNKEIEQFDIYILTPDGQLIRTSSIESTADYDHSQFELHHFIPFSAYVKAPEWYEQRGVKQKLILMRKVTHEQVEQRAVKNMTDEEFFKHYKISRWELVFSKKYSKY